jgi:hypothetical protein
MTSGNRLAQALLAIALLAAACRSAAPTAQPPGTEAPEIPGAAGPTAFAPGPADTPTQPAPPPTGLPSPTGQPTGFHGLIVPEDWFFTTVESGEIEAVVFTPLDPAALAAFDDPELAVPPDFVIAALVRSPLPAGSDPDALQAGMEASLANFTSADLSSLLAGADRIGLIDLAAIETITVESAERGELGGRPAIAVRGAADFGPDSGPGVQLLVLLAWTEDAFFTFYGIAAEAAWDGAALPLGESVGTVTLE